MATTKLGNSKSASRSINYAESRAVAMSGLNVDITYAKSSFKAIRAVFGKESGVQVHTIIQSFSHEESKKLGADKINEMGKSLAERVASEYQVAIYTHDDKEHIHNHIVINAVHPDTGMKYQSNAKQRYLIKEMNDQVALEHGLEPVERGTAAVTYSLAEREVLKKGDISWKQQIREAIDFLKKEETITTFNEFRHRLEDDFGIGVKKRGKTLSYKHPDVKRNIRGNKLGADFDKEELENVFTRHLEREEERRRKREKQKIRRINRGPDLSR